MKNGGGMSEWTCKRCNTEKVEITKLTIELIALTLKPKFLSLPYEWENTTCGWVKICPECDAYALGIDMVKGYPVRNKAGEKTRVQKIFGID